MLLTVRLLSPPLREINLDYFFNVFFLFSFAVACYRLTDKCFLLGIYVDAGSGMQRLYLINPAIGCSNGIIYVIDGFLNYSPFNLIEMIYRETAVR